MNAKPESTQWDSGPNRQNCKALRNWDHGIPSNHRHGHFYRSDCYQPGHNPHRSLSPQEKGKVLGRYGFQRLHRVVGSLGHKCCMAAWLDSVLGACDLVDRLDLAKKEKRLSNARPGRLRLS